MTTQQIMQLQEGTPIRVKKENSCADAYKKNSCRLSFYNHEKTGKVEYNPDTKKLDIYFPFGVELIDGGVCYLFRAEEIELV